MLIRNFEDFIDVMVGNVEDHFAEKHDEPIDVKTIKTTRGTYTGMHLKGKNAAYPVYDLDAGYEDYQNGRDIDDLLESAAQIMEMEPKVNCDVLTSSKVPADKIRARVANKANVANLDDRPHIDLAGDIVTVFDVILDEADDIRAFSSVTNEIIASWGVDANEITKIALTETIEKEPPIMQSLIAAALGRHENDPYIAVDEPFVISTKAQYNGAVAIAYPGFLKAVSEQVFDGKGFFILPSSVHEVIIVSEEHNPIQMRSIVRNVNSMEGSLEPGDFLSNDVFHYNPATDEIETIDDYRTTKTYN